MLGDALKIVKWQNRSGWVALQWVDRNWYVDKWETVESRTDQPKFAVTAATDSDMPAHIVWRMAVPAEIVKDALRRSSSSSDGLVTDVEDE